MSRLRVDHLALEGVPESDLDPYDLQVVLSRELTEDEGELLVAAWDGLSSPELHSPGHVCAKADVLVFTQTSRQEFFLRHRARLNQVLQQIERQKGQLDA